MSIQTSSGVFPIDSWGNALVDSIDTPGNLESVWTPGALSVQPLAINPRISQKWKLLGISVNGALNLGITGAGLFGKLGKLSMGLYTPPQNIPSTLYSWSFFHIVEQFYTAPYIGSQTPLPTDSTLTTDIWTPDADPLPPVSLVTALADVPYSITPSSPFLPVSTSLLPPNPLDLEPGEDIGLGVWFTPSLIGINNLNVEVQGFFLALSNLNYTMTYDDGQ